MAELLPKPESGKGRLRRSPRVLRIDMTPLVDLGFLLITFFVFTTTLSLPAVTSLIMPKEGEPSEIGESNALTFLLGENNRVYAYQGSWETAAASNRITTTDYNTYEGMGKIIRDRQSLMSNNNSEDHLMVIIKPFPDSKYKNVIDALDEATINDVKRYAVVEPDAAERTWMEDRRSGN